MKIAIFSDIHGNDVAFEAAVNDAKNRGATEFIIAGDMVSDYPLSSQAIERARSLTNHIVRGNRESYFQKYHSSQDAHWKEYKQFAGMLWSFSHMKDEDFRFINSLPEQIEIIIDDKLSFYVTHYINDVNAFIPQMPQKVLVCGHVHRPAVSEFDDKVYINAGSVGVNMSIGFNAEYILVDYSNGVTNIQIIHVPYEYEVLKAALNDKTLIDNEDAMNWFKILLSTQRTGQNYISELFIMSEKLKAERGYECYDMPNEIWDELISMYKSNRIIE